jgi:hypothetical protein
MVEARGGSHGFDEPGALMTSEKTKDFLLRFNLSTNFIRLASELDGRVLLIETPGGQGVWK